MGRSIGKILFGEKTLDTQRRSLAAAEMEVVRLVLQVGQATVKDVCEMLPPGRNLGYKTVQTLLRRAEQKGYLRHTEEGRAHIFSSTIPENEILDGSIANFIHRQFRGDAFEMARRLVEGDHLSADELRRLRKRTKKRQVDSE